MRKSQPLEILQIVFKLQGMPSGGQNKKRSKENDEVISQLLSEGKSLSEAAAAVGVTVGTLAHWRLQDADFDNLCSRAQNVGFEVQADSLMTIPEQIQDVQRARLKSENIRWLLARRAAHKYGDRLEVNLNQTVDIKGALDAARARALPPCDLSKVIEAEARRIIETTAQSATDQESEGLPECTLIEDLPDVFS